MHPETERPQDASHNCESNDSFASPELIAFSVPVPPNLAETFGYVGDARFVGFFWDPGGDEFEFDDGRLAGTGEWHPFLFYLNHRAVTLKLCGYNFGYSDLPAKHWLILDRTESQAFVAATNDAQIFLEHQHLSSPDFTPEEIEEARRDIAEVLSTLLETPIQIISAEVEKRMREQKEAVERLLAFLDQSLLDSR